MSRSASRWKAHERAIAQRLGTVRQLHRDGRAGADVTIAGHDIQIKTRVSLPAWFTDAFDQAKRDCTEGKLPAVVFVLAPKQGVKARRFVVFDFEDWVRGLGDAIMPVEGQNRG